MFSSLSRCASKAALQLVKGVGRPPKPVRIPLYGHQTLALEPTVGRGTGVRQACALDRERLLQVKWDDGSCSFYPFTWLRDNCQCPGCTLQSAQARSLSFTDLDVNTGMDRVKITENNKVANMLYSSCNQRGATTLLFYSYIIVK